MKITRAKIFATLTLLAGVLGLLTANIAVAKSGMHVEPINFRSHYAFADTIRARGQIVAGYDNLGAFTDSLTYTSKHDGVSDAALDTGYVSLKDFCRDRFSSTAVGDSSFAVRLALSDAGSTGTIDTVTVDVAVSADGANWIAASGSSTLSMALGTTTNSKVFTRKILLGMINTIGTAGLDLGYWPMMRFVFHHDGSAGVIHNFKAYVIGPGCDDD